MRLNYWGSQEERKREKFSSTNKDKTNFKLEGLKVKKEKMDRIEAEDDAKIELNLIHSHTVKRRKVSGITIPP
jgi:hypothetical protein